MLYKQKHSKYWWMDFVDGRRRVRKSTRTTNRQDAEQIEMLAKASARRTLPQDFIHAMVDVLYGKRSSETRGTPLARLAKDYADAVQSIGKGIAPKTLQDRMRIAGVVSKYFNGGMFEDLTPADARAFASWYATKGLSAKTRHNHIQDYITVLRTLGLPSDAWRAVLPHFEINRRDCFTPDEERRVLAAAKEAGNCWYALSLISRHTGLREGDCIRLTWDNMDVENRCIRVRPSKTAKHGIEVVLPIPEDIWNEILSEASPRSQGAPLFPKWHDDHGVRFSSVLEAAGIGGNHTFHSWRHTFRTRLSEAGVPDEIAMRLGGWTQRSTAMRYDHAERIEELRAAVEKAKS